MYLINVRSLEKHFNVYKNLYDCVKSVKLNVGKWWYPVIFHEH